MSFRFILGRAGSGKTYYCLNKLASLIKEEPSGNDLVFLVPEQATFIHEKMLAEDFGLSGFCRVDVTSFSRLIYRARKELFLPKLTKLSKTGRMMALAKIILAEKDNLSLFSVNNLKSGITGSLLQVLDEIKIYNGEKQLEYALDYWQKEEGKSHFTAKLHDLDLLYQEIESFTREQYSDEVDGLVFLEKAVREREFLNGATILIDGFANFTPQEIKVICALVEKAVSVETALAFDPLLIEQKLEEVDLFYPLYDTYHNLYAAIKESGAVINDPLLLNCKKGRFAKNPELTFLEKNIYNRKNIEKWQTKPENIRITPALNKRREIENIAREINRLVREEGCRYREIGVIARDASKYESLITEIFKEMDIPYFIDSKKQLIYHPLVELIGSALEVVSEGWHYQTVFRYLKSGLIPVSLDEIDKLENYCLASGIRHYHWLSSKDWNFWPLSLSEKTPDQDEKARILLEINQIRKRAVGALVDFNNELGKENTMLQMVVLLRKLLIDLGVEDTLNCWSEAALLSGAGEEAAMHRQAALSIENLFAEAETFLGDTMMEIESLRSIFLAGLSELNLSLIPVGLDQVFIASIDRSRSPELKYCFIFDLNLGEFPAKITSNSVLSEKEREKLLKSGFKMAPSVNQRQFAETFLLYLAFTRANRGLYLSYSLIKEDGSAAMPSSAIASIKSLFPLLLEETPDTGHDLNLLRGGLGGLKDLLYKLNTVKNGEKVEVYWREVEKWYQGKPEYKKLFENINKGLAFQPQKYILKDENIKRLFGDRLYSSVSRLEKYRDCPFAYFAAYALKIEKRRIYQLSAPDKGQLFHQVLADIGKKIEREGLDWESIDKTKAKELVDHSLGIFLPCFLGEILSSSARYQYLAERLRSTLVQSLLFWVEHMKKGDYRPVAWEISFGPKGELPALTYQLQNGRELVISGQIDRIDIAQNGENSWIRVIDYKSGNENITIRDIEDGLKLQLLVYLEVALRNASTFGSPSAKAAGVYYALVRDDIYSFSEIPQKGEEEKGLLAGLKLKGLTVSEWEAVKLADREIEGYSKLIPIGIKKDGTYYQRQSGVTAEELAVLEKTIDNHLLATAEAMFSGSMAAEPNNNKLYPVCDYCDYKAFCGFEGEFARKKDLIPEAGGDHNE